MYVLNQRILTKSRTNALGIFFSFCVLLGSERSEVYILHIVMTVTVPDKIIILEL